MKMKMKDYSKKGGEYGSKQDVHTDKTGYDKLKHDKRTKGRGANMSYDALQDLVKKI